jgi:hypothetical protein
MFQRFSQIPSCSMTVDAEAQAAANLRRADRLRQSILKQAFSGQLIPQDPNDEPASVLLERIRANANVGARHAVPKARNKHHPSNRAQHAVPLRETKPAPAAPNDFTSIMALQAGLSPLDFSELAGARREEYFAAVRAGLDRDYEPMTRLFVDVIERSSF